MNIENIKNSIKWDLIIENKDELPLYEQVLEDIINYLDSNNEATFQEIIKYVNGNDRRTLRLIDQLVSNNFIVFDYPNFKLPGVSYQEITPDGVRCPVCDSKMIYTDGALKDVSLIMEKIFDNKFDPTFVFDQRPVNWKTSVRRAGYMVLRGDIKNKNIAVVGDDDLTSVAIALTHLTRRVTLFEIDERIIEFVQEISKKYDLDIEVVNVDLTKGIPSVYRHKFDVYTTDPTPTKAPFTVFTNQCLSLLKREARKVGYSSIYPSCKLKLIDIQEILTQMNFMITDLIPYFTQYDFVLHTYSDEDKILLERYVAKEEKISFYEYLLRCETITKTKKLDVHYTKKELVGSATMRVLKDPSKDPVLSTNHCDNKMYKYLSDLKKELSNE